MGGMEELLRAEASTWGGSDRKGGSHTWVAVQGLGVLTAAPGEAGRADAHIAAALRILTLAPVL